MHPTDERIRSLVAARVDTAPPPLTSEELTDRWRTVDRERPAPDTRRFGPRVGLVAAAAAIALLVTGLLVVANRDTGSSEVPPVPSVTGSRVGAYFLPATLPDDYRLLAVRERSGDPDAVRPGRSVWSHTPSGTRMSLRVGTLAERWPETADQAVDDGHTVRWSVSAPDDLFPTTFQVEDGEHLVDGALRGDLDVDRATLLAIAAAISLGADGVPSVADPEWRLVASAPPTTGPVHAEWSAYFGPPGGYFGAAGATITVRRFADGVDPELEQGVWSERSVVADRTVYTGMLGTMPRWYPAPDLQVEVQTSGRLGVADLIGQLVEVDGAAFAAEIATIASSAESLAVEDSATFESGIVGELLGPRDSPRGVCLTVDGERVCDLAIMNDAAYTYEDTVAATFTDLLVGGRWFTVGIETVAADGSAGILAPAGVSTVVLDDRTWYLLEHPPVALRSSEPAMLGPRGRPSR